MKGLFWPVSQLTIIKLNLALWMKSVSQRLKEEGAFRRGGRRPYPQALGH